MDDDPDVTQWIAALNAGDSDAAEKLWPVFFHRLAGLARQQIVVSLRKVVDEEDVALGNGPGFSQNSAMASPKAARRPRLGNAQYLGEHALHDHDAALHLAHEVPVDVAFFVNLCAYREIGGAEGISSSLNPLKHR